MSLLHFNDIEIRWNKKEKRETGQNSPEPRRQMSLLVMQTRSFIHGSSIILGTSIAKGAVTCGASPIAIDITIAKLICYFFSKLTDV